MNAVTIIEKQFAVKNQEKINQISPFFSLRVGVKESVELLGSWPRERVARQPSRKSLIAIVAAKNIGLKNCGPEVRFSFNMCYLVLK